MVRNLGENVVNLPRKVEGVQLDSHKENGRTLGVREKAQRDQGGRWESIQGDCIRTDRQNKGHSTVVGPAREAPALQSCSTLQPVLRCPVS